MPQSFTFLLIAFIYIYLPVSAQNDARLFKRCSVKTINYEQGLLNNGTTNIITDTLGFTWISTKTGMQRYNGYTMETINPVIGTETVFINSPVYFFALENGLIWISCKQGVLEYNPFTNSFKKTLSINSGKENFSIVPVKQTDKGIWCVKNNKTLILYTDYGAEIKEFPAGKTSYKEQLLKQREISTNGTFAVNKNSFFFYNSNNQIEQRNFKTYKTCYINVGSINSFTCSDTHLFIISDKELMSININTKKVEKNIQIKKIVNERITAGSVLLSQNKLLVSINSHLLEFDTICNYKREYTNFNRNAIVSQGFICTIYADRFKRIWLLTNNDIKRIQNIDLPFGHFIYTGEKNNFIRSIYYDEKKHLLLAGCYNGGIQLYDTSGNPLWPKNIISENVKDINAIEKIADDIYFIETIGRGWYILNLPAKKLTPFKIKKSLKNIIDFSAVKYVNNIQHINDSTLFISTATNVFNCVFKNENLTSVKRLLPLTRTAEDVIDCFLYTSDHTLWTGTNAGNLYKTDEHNHLKTFHIPDNYTIRSLAEDVRHNIWVGTDKGLYVYNLSGKLIKTIIVQSGLLNDCIYALLPVDKQSAVYASSNLGLSYVSLNGNIINYTKESGLQENEFNTGSAVKTYSGKFYFGGVNGITSFYPASLSNINDTPVLNITKFIVNDSAFNFSLLTKGNSLKLNHDQNHVQFDFAAIGLLNTTEYQYKYRLKGFEEKWQTTNRPTGIKYILEPGNYLFEISCSPVLSLNSVFAKEISIFISPPWWKMWWFEALMIISFIGVISLIVQQYLHGRYQQKLRLLQLQNEIQHERERISRDLHDNLGAYAAAIASNVADLKSVYISGGESVFYKLQNNSQSIINHLNDTIWALNKEAISLTAISDRFKLFLQKIQYNYPEVHIAIEENIFNDQKLSPANALHLFRIMQEAVNNALRHSQCENIFISINVSDTWNVIIKDDGKGFVHLNEEFNAGNGLKNIQLRSREAGWQTEWKIGVPKGTEVLISS